MVPVLLADFLPLARKGRYVCRLKAPELSSLSVQLSMMDLCLILVVMVLGNKISFPKA